MAHFDKDTERQHLEMFLSARKYAIGEELQRIDDSESPDFVCSRPNGELVGVEHTRIEYNPERTELLDSCGVEHGELDNFALLWAAGLAVAKKEAKRQKPHWRFPNATILVLDLPEGVRFEEWPDSPELSDQFAECGFLEVWISDHSSVGEFGEATAIGLFPRSIWGIQGQGYLWGVPYK